MSKTKESILSLENLRTAAATAGMLIMTAAVTLMTAEGAHRPEAKAVMPMEPALAPVSEHAGHDPVSRERNETAPHHVSYEQTQRTASRSGRQ